MENATTERARLKAAVRFEIDELMAASSPDEIDLLVAIERLPLIEISRASPSSLALLQTRRQYCHSNARDFEETDPAGKSRSVAGWWLRGDVFYFHSVVRYRDRLICITPGPDMPPLRFAPDADIRWQLDGSIRKATRWGRTVPRVVRRNPAAVVATCQDALRRLEAGEHPLNIRLIGQPPARRARRGCTSPYVNLYGNR